MNLKEDIEEEQTGNDECKDKFRVLIYNDIEVLKNTLHKK